MSVLRRHSHTRAASQRALRSSLARGLLAATVLAAVASPIAGCGRVPEDARVAESVTLALQSGPRAGLVLLAAEKRYFAEQGLDVKFKRMAMGTAAIDAVHTGEADLALATETPFVFAVLNKKNVRLLARLYRSRSFVSIVARRDRGIDRARDLAGKRIGFVSDRSADFFAESYLEFQGIGPGQFTRAPLTQDQVEKALIDGEVDAVTAWHPYSTRLLARLGPKAIAFNDPTIYQMHYDLIARPDFASSRPEVARRFIAALRAALDFLREHPREAKRLIVQAGKEDAELSASIWRAQDYTLTLDESLLGGLEDYARWALAKTGTAEAKLPNFLDFIDPRPLRSVQAEAVSILLP